MESKPGVDDPWAKSRKDRRERVQKNKASKERNEHRNTKNDLKVKRGLVDEKGNKTNSQDKRHLQKKVVKK